MNLCKRPESFLLKVWWWAWVKIRIKGFQLKEVAFDLQLIHHCNLFQGKRDQKKIFPPPNDACFFSPYYIFAYILFKRVSFFLRHQSTTLSFRNPFSLFLIFFFVPIFFFLFLAWVWVKSLPICISNLIGWWHRNTQRFTLLHSLSTWLAVWDFERRVAFLCVTFQPFFYVSSHFHRKYETEGKLSRGNSWVTCLIFNPSQVSYFFLNQIGKPSWAIPISPYLPFCPVQHWFGLSFRSFITATLTLYIHDFLVFLFLTILWSVLLYCVFFVCRNHCLI